ncbi:NAF1-domain-containing protein [Coprinopsis marcescibilis]|uniref:H/ACA ribonucleoprotein complex non-core subunit NAF1 n=1 Tax=Coprinopsis marcescibilis TaxID=230819 RepID=A0A5C3KJD2_COPMA|nr:NAF1-domain-containing protein [Coprinopsis marcescibilis]
MADFKIPDPIPQDLLLIQELIGPVEPENPSVTLQEKPSDVNGEEDISSSGSEDEAGNDSEDEVAANLVTMGEDSAPASPKPVSEPSDTSSESSSDSESESESATKPAEEELLDDLDDEDAAPTANAAAAVHTKHEIVDADVTIPEVDEVGVEEPLRKAGEIISVMERIAIVRGLSSEVANQGSQYALDSETLLVFDDRKVLGYIYETFGPTTQPLYQIKFNSKFPLDAERVKTGREVFAVPSKSKFVFIERIKAFRGSDASNVYDEEPADDELEFSDDEAESSFKSRLKRKRAETRSRSVVHSREATPNPSHLRDQQLVDDTVLSRSAYDENGPYDIDFAAVPGPSRPRPSAYDDPYANLGENESSALTTPQVHGSHDTRMDNRPQARGRGRGRGRGQPGRGRGGFHGSEQGRAPFWSNQHPPAQYVQQQMPEPYDPRAPQQAFLSPQHNQNQGFYGAPVQQQMGFMNPAWTYPPPQQGQQAQHLPQHYNFDFNQQMSGMPGIPGMTPPFVQPHINPRFAPAFGMAFAQQQQQNFNGNQTPGQEGTNPNTNPWPSQ